MMKTGKFLSNDEHPMHKLDGYEVICRTRLPMSYMSKFCKLCECSQFIFVALRKASYWAWLTSMLQLEDLMQKTSFMLFLNKFDIFEKKVSKVPLNVCEWFKDYQPVSTGKQEVEHAYEFVKKKFEELYYQNVTCDHQDRVFKIYRTTALDQKLVKKTFKLVDETLRRRNLFEAGLL
ncbi:Guanine nucleotide binding protein (G-protein), alpha subunit [Cynara cardunculus var. scolymus]|uniref:Guanine nucleotide-binding protein alpha subunit n=1 Tax=Cynara cardunculus var. scolymus TaxID=59895 RepID=A0A103XN83_CYNCS|nr:Guanine nucleotide binding protein (G-protein), alpha subunit [Cynara cardunculus var. scolymus]